jgi:hypothetical protein
LSGEVSRQEKKTKEEKSDDGNKVGREDQAGGKEKRKMSSQRTTPL